MQQLCCWCIYCLPLRLTSRSPSLRHDPRTTTFWTTFAQAVHAESRVSTSIQLTVNLPLLLLHDFLHAETLVEVCRVSFNCYAAQGDNAPVTRLMQGSSFNVTFHLAYPHRVSENFNACKIRLCGPKQMAKCTALHAITLGH